MGINRDALRVVFVSREQVIAYNKCPGIVILGQYALSLLSPLDVLRDLFYFLLSLRSITIMKPHT